MEYPFGSLAPKEAKSVDPTPARATPSLVENVGRGAGAQAVCDWAILQQQQAAKNDRLFQMLAKQQKAILNQVMASQAAANQQLWDQVAQSLATPRRSEGPRGLTAGTVAAPQLSIKTQKMTQG